MSSVIQKALFQISALLQHFPLTNIHDADSFGNSFENHQTHFKEGYHDVNQTVNGPKCQPLEFKVPVVVIKNSHQRQIPKALRDCK